MKKFYKKRELICTIISDTPYCYDTSGRLLGLGSTVEEIDHLSSLFLKIYHFAPLEKNIPPLSYSKHLQDNIKVLPMIPAGGKNLAKKLKHIFVFPFHLFKIKPYLNKTDIIHFRGPSGFGLLFLPWLYFFWKKKIWIKYGGSWESNSVPIAYKFQRWLLKRFSNNTLITINSSTKNLNQNFHQFKNPCFKEILIKTNKNFVQDKAFHNGLNLVFVGRVEKNKGVDDLFKVFHEIGDMPNIRSLKIVGGSKREIYYKKQARLASQKISMLGILNRKEVFKIFKESHILILLSKSEGFPKVIMEAGIFGCVPIVSNFHGVSEIIKNGHDGFIMNQYNDSYDTSEFKLILEDSKKLKSCSINIFKNSHSFTYESYLKSIENVIFY